MRVFDTGTNQDGHPFYIAEYLPRTFKSLLADGVSKIPLDVRLSYTTQLLAAIRFLGSQTPAYIHRDIKPSNIFVKGLSSVLGDFGLIKVEDSDSGTNDADRELWSKTLGPAMPRRYRTPDQVLYFRDKVPITAKSDTFQLGLVISELLTGVNPERATDLMEADVELDDLPRIDHPSGDQILNLLQSMLKFDPAKRPDVDALMTAWLGILFSDIDQKRDKNELVFEVSTG